MESRIAVGKEIAMREEKDDRFVTQVENRAAIERANATRDDAAVGYAAKQKEKGMDGEKRRRNWGTQGNKKTKQRKRHEVR